MRADVELTRLSKSPHADLSPPDIPSSLIFYVPVTGKSNEVFQKIKVAWQAVVAWGSLYDGDYDESMSDEDRMRTLPDFCQRYFSYDTVPAWQCLYELARERDWIWWNGVVEGHIIKIDVNLHSYPVSLGALKLIGEACGANFVVAVKWVPMQELLETPFGDL